MKLAWIADYDHTQHPGGAQLTNRIMLENAPLKIDKFTHENIKKINLKKYDLLILNNVLSLPDKLLRNIIEHSNYIKYEHDWQGITDFKKKFPDIYKNSRLNIFLSPFALNVYSANGLLPAGEGNCVCVSSPIESFFDIKIPEKDRRPAGQAIYTGELVPHKVAGLIDWARGEGKDYTVELYGSDHGCLKEVRAVDNLRYMGRCQHKDLNMIYNQYRTFVHFPRAEPFGRTVAEAYLCGCKLLTNQRVGFLSYDWDYGDYGSIREKLCEKAPRLFWKHIESVLKKL
ncbi:MAG: hypothetical protein ACLFN5_04980 [bacterium]